MRARNTRGATPHAPAHQDEGARNLRPGTFLRYHGGDYRVVPNAEGVPGTHITLEGPLGEGMRRDTYELLLEDVLFDPDDGTDLIVAPTLDGLRKRVREATGEAKDVYRVATPALREGMLEAADRVIETVETVERLVAEERRRMVEAGRGAEFRGTPALRGAVARLRRPVCIETYYNHRRKYRTFKGDRDRIAADLHRSTLGETRMSKHVQHMIDMLILRHPRAGKPELYRALGNLWDRTGGRWIDLDRVADVPEKLVDALFNADVPIEAIASNDGYRGPDGGSLLVPVALPLRTRFYDHVTRIEASPGTGKQYMDERYGEGTWDKHYRIFDIFITHAQRPLQYVWGDHYKIDVRTVDKETRSTHHRLWLTILIDAYTRAVVGMALLDEDPCIESIQTATAHAIWPKTSHKRFSRLADKPWVCWGNMQQLFVDNAWAHHSHSVERLMRRLGCGGDYTAPELHFRQPYMARKGALVERFFGNLALKIRSHLAGAIRSRDPKAIRDGLEEACLLYEDIDEFLHEKILEYMHTPHRELRGLTPHEKWMQSIERSGQPKAPRKTDERERWFWRLHPEPRTIRKQGIEFLGLHYHDPRLDGEMSVRGDGSAADYYLAYRPSDISQVAVFKDDEYVGYDVRAKELRMADGSYEALSKSEWDIARRLIAERRRQRDRSLNALQSLEEWRKRAEVRKAEREAIQKELAAAATPVRKPGGPSGLPTPRRGKGKGAPSAATPVPEDAVIYILPAEKGDRRTELAKSFGRRPNPN